MKGKKMLNAMSFVDEKYIKEAEPGRVVRHSKVRVISAILAACLCMALIGASMTMLLPKKNNGVVRETAQDYLYSENDYREVIQGVETYVDNQKQKEQNNKFNLDEELWGGFKNIDAFAVNGAVTETATDNTSSESDSQYKEITDNQVDGVTEGDHIKRSDKYIYYLDGSTMRIFNIDGENSKEIGAYSIYDGKKDYNTNKWEIYLSNDCKTVMVMTSYMEDDKLCTGLVTLDVSNPENVKENGKFAIMGNYISSRVTKDNLLLVTEYAFKANEVDYDKPETFLPMIDTGKGFVPISADKIVVPDDVNSLRYTVALLLDEKSLEMKAVTANLSYTEDIYVTSDHLYLARVFAGKSESGENAVQSTNTEITCLKMADNDFEKLGCVTVRGYIKDKWSIDEYNGMLRIVTTTNALTQYHLSGSYNPVSGDVLKSAAGGSSASIYCVDINTWEIAGKVEEFAPKYEEVQSVRFDKNTAYVCTSIEMSDPVFFFDLSDVKNITYKETGTISGYSSSLVDFGNGYLLGIGMGDWSTFKVEIYEETETGVHSVTSYTKQNTDYSTEYKSYLIDRDNQLVGLGLTTSSLGKWGIIETDTAQKSNYVLLHFNGYELVELASYPLNGSPEIQRGVVIDTYLYMFGKNDFQVKKINL